MPLPKLKLAAQALARRQRIMKLVGDNMPLIEIAQAVKLDVRSVRRHLTAALRSESLYPGSYDAAQIAELRQIEGELMSRVQRRASTTIDKIEERIGTPKEKQTDASSVASLLQTVIKASERKAKLMGMDAPTKVVEESLRLNISKTETNIKITWDPEMLKAPSSPVPGLFIGGRMRTESLPDRYGEHNGNEPDNTAAA